MLPGSNCCLLLGRQGYVVLRQHYMTGGESLITEWHQQFVEQKAAEDKQVGPAKRSKATILRNFRRLLDPSNPVRHSCMARL